MTLQWIDWLVICLYAVTILSAGFLLARKTQSSEGYFLAGRALRWPVIGASLFAANISAEHFVGLAGSGYAVGMAVGGYEWSAVFCLVPLIVLFLHLVHGLQAVVIDLGGTGKRLRAVGVAVGGVLALAVLVGNILIPVAVLTGVVS